MSLVPGTVRDLVIIGAGGFARETAATINAINDSAPAWRLLGFLDDDSDLHGTMRGGVPVLGGLDLAAELTDAQVVVCVANSRAVTARRQVVERLALPEQRYATVIHPAAHLGTGTTLGPGCVLLAQAVTTADVSIGSHVLVMPHTVLTHDDRVGDYVTIAAGVRIGGNATISQGAYLGAGAVIREGIHVGSGALVGMAAVVLRDVPEGQVWAGSPARYLRDVGPG